MEKKENKQFKFGLIGKDISYSFSRKYFTKKFKKLELSNHCYVNFDLQKIEAFEELLQNNNDVKGFNVTIPYKQAIITYLDELSETAKKIGAVNTIKIEKNKLKGYNTDFYGFKNSLEPFVKNHHKKALILGTGGASKAIAFALEEMGILHQFVSRNPNKNELSYQQIDEKILNEYSLLVNCTPLGTHPNVMQKPNIPYECIAKDHLLFDLIYNPEKTAFLLEGESRGASICNGYRMLELQAEKAWEIWNRK